MIHLPNTKPNHMIMFSLQQSDELVFHELPSLISFQQEDLRVDLHEHVTLVEGTGKTSTNLRASRTRKGRRNQSSNKPNSAAGGPAGDGEHDQTQKKVVHREIERQRRQEMTKLYASLTGLLPPGSVKGKRSISDHMHQAVDYIRQVQENIKGLSIKRDQLKKFPDIIGRTRTGINTSESSINQLPNTVSVSYCNGGVEILINSCLMEDGFALSGVLNALVEEGLNVISCSSTKVNQRSLHSIQSKASDLALIDLSILQQRLVAVANTRPNFN